MNAEDATRQVEQALQDLERAEPVFDLTSQIQLAHVWRQSFQVVHCLYDAGMIKALIQYQNASLPHMLILRSEFDLWRPVALWRKCHVCFGEGTLNADTELCLPCGGKGWGGVDL